MPSVRENESSTKTHLMLVFDAGLVGEKKKWTRRDHLEYLLILAGYNKGVDGKHVGQSASDRMPELLQLHVNFPVGGGWRTDGGIVPKIQLRLKNFPWCDEDLPHPGV